MHDLSGYLRQATRRGKPHRITLLSAKNRILGGTVLQWLALLSCGKKVPSSNLVVGRGLFWAGSACFPPPTVQRHAKEANWLF